MALTKIASGGRTGVDRAALDAALAVGFPCGGRGSCPAQRIRKGHARHRSRSRATKANADAAKRSRRRSRQEWLGAVEKILSKHDHEDI
jgi:hypothetical protein